MIGFWCLGSWSGDRDSLLYHGQLRQEINISHGTSSQRVKDMTESMKRKETNNERVQGYLEKTNGVPEFFWVKTLRAVMSWEKHSVGSDPGRPSMLLLSKPLASCV